MHNAFIDALVQYKKSAALLAAFHMGLFRQIEKHGIIDGALCDALGWNRMYVQLLCQYLADQDLLRSTGNGWTFHNSTYKEVQNLDALAKHEYNVYHKWLLPKEIIQAVSSKSHHRPFDETGFSLQEEKDYEDCVFGKNMSLLAFHIVRRLKQKDNIFCLEYGRSEGRLGNCLQKHLSYLQLDILPFHEKMTEKFYDLILIANSFHYLNEKEWTKQLHLLKQHLLPGGKIGIADMFYDPQKKGDFHSTLLLDWLTHGGIYNPCTKDAMDILSQCGFEVLESHYIAPISTDLFIVC